ncbi:MAG TPA: ATP-binding protein [Roseiflexaceae bacterium]|nr:ATP-binding protein [Roseiflexaceae bacterium]
MPAHDYSERQRLFDRIMASSPDLVYLYDVRRGRNVYANRVLETILGYQPERAQALGPDFLATVLHPDDLAAHPETLRRIGQLPEGAFYEHVYRARHADGAWRWLCDRTVVFERAADGTAALILGVVQDITERRALATDNARLYQEAQQHAARMQLLAESSRVFAEASLNLPLLLEQIARHIATHIGDCCVIRLLSADGVWLEPVAIAHPDPQALALLRTIVAEEPLAVGEGITGRAVLQGRPVLIETLSPEDARALIKPGYLPYLDRVGLASVLIMPLLVRGQTIGMLFLSRDTPLRPYTGDDQTLLEDIASRAALAINHARLYEAEQQARASAERSADRMARLQAVTAGLAQAATPTQMAAVIVEHGMAVLGAVTGTVRRLSADGLFLEDTHAVGVPVSVIAGMERIPISANLPVAEAVRQGHDLWLPSADTIIARYPQTAPIVREHGYGAFAALLLAQEGRTIGVLGITFALSQTFSEEDRVFLRAMAQQCTQALERARLYEAERKARAEAEAAVQVRDRFLSVAAHELKTPLTPLLGQAQLLERRAAADGQLDERYRRSAQVIAEQAGRLSLLIARLLDLSRLQSARAALASEQLDLSALARRLVEELRPTLTQHTLELALPPAPLLLNGDSVRLGQVLGNLLQNALKYSPGGGAVALELRREDGWACVEVRDQGIGIPAEALPHLFTPFFRAANASRSATGGMGLGLSVVKELVELHGGRISVESAEGLGSRFCVWLPTAEH